MQLNLLDCIEHPPGHNGRVFIHGKIYWNMPEHTLWTFQISKEFQISIGAW